MDETALGTWITQTLPSLGIGGLLAGFMFYFYRKDSQRCEDRWAKQSEDWMRVVQDNTAAITKLAERLEK